MIKSKKTGKGFSKKLPYFLVFGAFVYAGTQLHSFLTEEVPKLQSEINTQTVILNKKQADLKRVHEFAQNIEGVKLKLRELNLQLESALEAMPKTYNLSSLLRKIAMIAGNSGVELQSFVPGSTPERKKDSFYETLDVSLNIKGSFGETLVFMDQMARLKRLTKLEDISFSVATDPNSEADKNLPIRNAVAGKLKVYRFIE